MKLNDLKLEADIKDAIGKNYDLDIEQISFIPVGEESFSYVITTQKGKYFVKYCEQVNIIHNIDKVNELLIELKDLSFIIPPIEHNGNISLNIGNGKAYVYPYMEGNVVNQGNGSFDNSLVSDLTHIMAVIHKRSVAVDLPKETFENDFMSRFEALFKFFENKEGFDDVKRVLFDNRTKVEDIINKHTKVGEQYKELKPELVLTHGDITGLNIIQTSNGIKLVDWDGAMFAPAERDINFLFTNQYFSLDKYVELSGKQDFDIELKKYYGREWSLNSIIGNFESILKGSHAKTNQNEYLEEINKYLSYYK
jgi:thiamine kinase-like enzyme